MNAFISTPFFGIFLSIFVFWVGTILFKKYHWFIFQPLFLGSILGIVIILLLSKLLSTPVPTMYTNYKIGGDIVFWFLNPATIAFAVPLYKRRALVKKYWVQIIVSLLLGFTISLILIYLVSLLLGLSKTSTISMLPQAATTAIALPITNTLAGGGTIGAGAGTFTAMAVITNAVVVYALGDKFVKLFKLEKSPFALGLSFGTAGHTLGAAKAIEYNPTAGAMASISMVIIGLIVDLVVPVFAQLVGLV